MKELDDCIRQAEHSKWEAMCDGSIDAKSPFAKKNTLALARFWKEDPFIITGSYLSDARNSEKKQKYKDDGEGEEKISVFTCGLAQRHQVMLTGTS